MAKTKFNLLIFLTTLLWGCGGTVWEEAYFPIATTLPTRAASEVPYKINDNYDHIANLILGDDEIEITAYKVLLSEKLSMVYGPAFLMPTPTSEVKTYDENLMIMVSFKVRRGIFSLNTHDVIVKLDGSNHIHRPTSITQSPPGTENSTEVSGLITISATNNKQNLQFLHFFYDIPKTDLGPFVLQFGELQLNGKVVNLPDLPFERRGRYAPR